jgi:hypothetical protein
VRSTIRCVRWWGCSHQEGIKIEVEEVEEVEAGDEVVEEVELIVSFMT